LLEQTIPYISTVSQAIPTILICWLMKALEKRPTGTLMNCSFLDGHTNTSGQTYICQTAHNAGRFFYPEQQKKIQGMLMAIIQGHNNQQ
jgi:prepilin-type processing-associated H-X9-DG protein